MKKRVSMLVVVLACALAMFAKDFKSAVFSVPQMVCENCEAKVLKNIRFEKGVKEIKTNVEKQTVTIVYDADKTNPKKLTEGFAKFKYEVTEIIPGSDKDGK